MVVGRPGGRVRCDPEAVPDTNATGYRRGGVPYAGRTTLWIDEVPS
jgi:hypothetical protein